MRILAIDPGSKLGWATNQTGRLEWGTEDFRIKNGESSGNRWRRFGEWLIDATRTKQANEVDPPTGLKRWAYDPIDLVIYERAHFMPKARAAAEIAAGFTTRLEEHCERHGIALHPVAVQTLKAFAVPAPPWPKRKKGDPILPRHDQGKAAMIMAAGHKLTGTESRMVVLDEHEADALWLYWWAEKNCGNEARIAGDAHP